MASLLSASHHVGHDCDDHGGSHQELTPNTQLQATLHRQSNKLPELRPTKLGERNQLPE